MTDNEIKAVIAKYLKLRVRTPRDVIAHTDMSQATYYRKMNNPSTLTVDEFRQIFDYLKVPKEERVI